MPQTRKYDVSFRIFVTGGILAGAILLFSFLEPEGTSHSTNVVLAFIMGAIVLGTVVCAYVLPYMDAMSQLRRSFEWELTSDKVVQRHRDGRATEIALHDVKSLYERRGWLMVTGADPSKGIAIPSNLEGFEQIRRELTAHCAETPMRVKISKLPWTAEAIFALASLLAVFSHNLAVFLISSAIVLLVWPVWVAYSLRGVWQTRKVPNRLLLAYFLIWLLMFGWVVFRSAGYNFRLVNALTGEVEILDRGCPKSAAVLPDVQVAVPSGGSPPPLPLFLCDQGSATDAKI